MQVGVQYQIFPRVGDQVSPALINAIEACAECARVTAALAESCAPAEADYLRDCVQLSLDCAEMCTAAGEMASRGAGSDGYMVAQLLSACASTADLCAFECEQHSDTNAYCARCARLCRACAAACRRALASAAH